MASSDVDRCEELDIEKLREQIERGEATVSKEEVRKQISEFRKQPDASVLDTNADFRMVERWCHTLDPVPTTVSDEAIDSITERCCSSSKEVVRRKKRLRSQFAVHDHKTEQVFRTNSGHRRCPHCVQNNVCMAAGCNIKPLDLAFKRQGFRCLLEMHLCNKHGLIASVNNQRRDTVTLKDGRVLGNVFEFAAFPSRKHQKRKRVAAWPPKRSVLSKDLLTAMMVVKFIEEYHLHDCTLAETLKAIAESTDADE